MYGFGRNEDAIFCIPQMSTAVQCDYRGLKSILDGLHNAYHGATRNAVAVMGQIGWDRMWDSVVKTSADQLVSGSADAFEVRQKLEALVEAYRRTTSNPLQLCASLEVQDAVAAHVTALEQWCSTNAISNGDATTKKSPVAWEIMRTNATCFYGWFPGADSFNCTRLPWNLYADPHSSSATPIVVLCHRSRLTTIFCALAETLRLMDVTPPPELGIYQTHLHTVIYVDM